MKKIVYSILTFAPVLALAQTVGNTNTALGTVIDNIRGLINKLIPVLIAIAIVYFFWGLIEFVRSAGDPKKAEEGKSHMIWGLVAVVIMVSIFGLISWIQSATGITAGTLNSLPQIPAN